LRKLECLGEALRRFRHVACIRKQGTPESLCFAFKRLVTKRSAYLDCHAARLQARRGACGHVVEARDAEERLSQVWRLPVLGKRLKPRQAAVYERRSLWPWVSKGFFQPSSDLPDDYFRRERAWDRGFGQGRR
jgi:hypothetical protein